MVVANFTVGVVATTISGLKQCLAAPEPYAKVEIFNLVETVPDSLLSGAMIPCLPSRHRDTCGVWLRHETDSHFMTTEPDVTRSIFNSSYNRR